MCSDESARFPDDPAGGIDLRREIKLNRQTSVVERQRGSIRSVYSARIEGRKSDMTVALYQGDGAEEVCLATYNNMVFTAGQEWRQHISKVSWLR